MAYFLAGVLIFLLLFKLCKKTKHKTKQFSFALKSERFFVFKNEFQRLKEEIENKLNNNIPNKFNQKIDFFALKNANIFQSKQIFKIVVAENNFWKKEFLVFKSIKESKSFTLIFQVKNQNQQKKVVKFLKEYNFQNFKIINLSDINFNLLYEINKLNINYSPEQSFKPKILVNTQTIKPKQKNFCLLKKTEDENFICTYESFANVKNENVFNLKFSQIENFNVFAKQNVCVNIQTYLQLNSQFITYTQALNQIYVVDENNIKKVYHTNYKIKDVKHIKYNQESFLIITFDKILLKKNQTKNMVLSEEKLNFEDIKNIKLKSYLNFKNATNFNFLSKNDVFNAFFNKKLSLFMQKMILNQKYSLKIFNLKLQSLNSISLFFKKFLGLKFENNFVEVKPKFEYKINIGGLTIETQKGEENSVLLNGVKFVNLNKIDLNLLNTNNLTFVYKNVL